MSSERVPMRHRTIVFKSSREVETTRKDFDKNCAINLQNYEDIVGKCEFTQDDRVLCQLDANGDGSVCKQEHWNGWLVRRKDDGKEGYIGGDCANRHFLADERFGALLNRARSEIRIDRLVERLEILLENRTQLREKLTSALDHRRELSVRIRNVLDKFPDPVRHRIRDMGKTGNTRIVLEFARVDENDSGERIRVWEEMTVGSVSDLEGLDTAAVYEIGERLKLASSALDEAEASCDRAERTLRKWADSLDDIDRCEHELDDIEAALRRFVKLKNLRLLCWTVRRDSDQLAVARVALEDELGRRASDSEVASARKAWSEEVRRAGGSSDFRVP